MPERPGRHALGVEQIVEAEVAARRGEATETGGSASPVHRTSDAAELLEPGAELQHGRFVIRRALGVGGMGVVYEADDRLLECPVALKTLLAANTKRFLDLKREFRSLEGLSHPNLVKLGELFEDRGLLFFTMELVHGEPFTRYVRPGDVTVARLCSSLVQLTHGLMALHDAGKIHRDVKPSNTLVEATGRVVLLDFGLLVDAPLAEPYVLAGTAEYMAPEQLSGRVTAAADWYALGVMLYESVTGRLPFPSGVRSVNKAHKPDTLPSAGAGVPPEVARLCLDLLEPDPTKRPSGTEILQRLTAAGVVVSTGPRASARPLSSFPASGRYTRAPRASRKLVGRRNELARMDGAFAAACERGPRVLFIVGEPGVGKSALLSEFGADVQGRALVLSSRCHENEFLAHKALDGIVDGLFQELDRGPLSLVEGLPAGDHAALVQVFPVLRPLFEYGAPDDAPSDPMRTVHSVRRAAFRSLRVLLERLSQHRPLVLVIDDLQWADVDSLRSLELLMTGETTSPIFLMMAARGGTEAPRFEIPHERLDLGPLDPESATELARALLSEQWVTSVAASDLAEEARRLPLFVEMLAYYSSLQEGARSVDLEGLLGARLDGLAPSQLLVLELLCVAAGPVAQKQLSIVSGLKLASLVAELRDLQIGHWIVTRQRDGDATLEPYHASVRQAVLARMGTDERREAHRAWAVGLEAAPEKADPETLARHWFSAGDAERAIDYVIEAAKRAEGALAFDRAAKLYGWALDLAPDRHSDRAQLTHRYAQSLSNAGRARDAATAYLQACELAPHGERWGYQLRAAEQLLRAGYVDEGLKTVDLLLRSVGMTLPSHPIGALARSVGERLLRVNPVSRFASRSRESTGDLTRRADACYAVALGLAQVDPFASAAFTARYMRYAHALHDEQRIAFGLCLLAPQAASRGQGPPAERAHRMLARVRAAIKTPTGKSRLEAHLALTEAAVAFLLGDFGTTVRCGRSALAMFAALPGSTWETGTAQRFVLTSLWHTGRMNELERHTKELVEDADERKDRYTANQLRTTVVPIVHLKNDEPERALSELTRADRDLPPPRTSLQRWQYRQHAALVALYLEKPLEALDLMSQQEAGVGRLMLNRVAAMRISVAFHRATAILAAMSSHDGHEIRGRARLLRRDIRSIRRTTLEHIPCLLEAQMARLSHDDAAAAALLERAQRLFTDADMSLFAAVCAWGRSAVGACDPAHRERAKEWMLEQGIKNPRRFVRLLAPVFAK
jgi:hypothetical protein